MNLYKHSRAVSSTDEHYYPFAPLGSLATKPCFANWPRILRSMMRSFQLMI